MILRLNGSAATAGSIAVADVKSETLTCYSELLTYSNAFEGARGDWYLNDKLVLETKDPRGWEVDRRFVSGHQEVRLRRISDYALEGEFTCHIEGDTDSFASLRIYYPSESSCMHVQVYVISYIDRRMGRGRIYTNFPTPHNILSCLLTSIYQILCKKCVKEYSCTC